MRKTYFSEIQKDEESGRLIVIEYQYEPPESGEGVGNFFEVRFRPRLPWRHVLLLGSYLLALAGVELVMVEDNAKVGVGLLALVAGGFYAILSSRRVSVTAGKRISGRLLDNDRIPVETIEGPGTRESAQSTGSLQQELALLLQRATEEMGLHYNKAQLLAKRSAVLAAAAVTLSVLAAITSLFAAVNGHSRTIAATIAAVTVGSAAFAVGLQRTLQDDVRADQHRRAAAAWGDMREQITQIQSHRGVDHDADLRVARELASAIEELAERSPRLTAS